MYFRMFGDFPLDWSPPTADEITTGHRFGAEPDRDNAKKSSRVEISVRRHLVGVKLAGLMVRYFSTAIFEWAKCP